MSWLRAKTCVFILFGLITFGQAYPYSYIWAEGGHAECGCNDAGRKCIHGCDLKKKSSAHEHHAAMGHHDHAAMQDHGSRHGHENHTAIQTKDQDDQPNWVSPSCSKQKKREILSFRGDPCVPRFVRFFLQNRVSKLGDGVFFKPIQRAYLPDPPPPKA